MFIYPQATGISLSNLRQGQKFDKKYKNRIKDPNEGLDYASSVNYVQPMFQQKFQSDKFVKDLLQKCKNIQKNDSRINKESKNEKSNPNIAKSLGVKRISNNSRLIQGIFKMKSKVRKRIISKARTEAVSFQNDLIEQKTKNPVISNQKQNKSFFEQMISNNQPISQVQWNHKVPKYDTSNQHFILSKKINKNRIKFGKNQDQQSNKYSDGSQQNDQIFLKSTFLKNKKFQRNKQFFSRFPSQKNPFNNNSSNYQVKTAQFSTRHKFKPHKTQFSNQVAFIKRKSDYLKLNAQNINQFVQQVIENYGNRLKGRISAQSSAKLIQFQGHTDNFYEINQRKIRNNTQNVSSQSLWSRNSISRTNYNKNKNLLTSNSFYTKRAKTQQTDHLKNKVSFLKNNQYQQQKNNNPNPLKTIT